MSAKSDLEEAKRRIEELETRLQPIYTKARPYWKELTIGALVVMVVLSLGWANHQRGTIRGLESRLTLQEDLDKATERLKGLEAKAKAQEEANQRLLDANAKAKEDSQRLWFQIQKRRAELDKIKPQQVAADVAKLPIAEKSKELEQAGIPNQIIQVERP